MSKNIDRIVTFKKYIPLLRQLVQKDLKLKYRRSFLGYLWSILNPLLIMLIMVAVFSHMFRFDIEHYPVYLLTGQLVFGFISESTNQAIHSITGNAALLKKTYVPKYIFPFSKVTSGLVNLTFSLAALFIVCVFSGVRASWSLLFIPAVLFQVYVFSLGLSLFLSQANVFFRDIQYIYNAFSTAWMYATPIFYPISQLPENLQRLLKLINPLYSYLFQFRSVVLNGVMPDTKFIFYGCCWSGAALAVGTLCFFKTQDRFILYI